MSDEEWLSKLIEHNRRMECEKHRDHKDICDSYQEWSAWADSKVDNGEVQSQCPLCKRWYFPEEM